MKQVFTLPPGSQDDRATDLVFAVRSPSTGEVLGQIRQQSEAEVSATVARARQAQVAWAQRSPKQRGEVVRRIVRRIRDDEVLLRTLSAESGKPRHEVELFELLYTVELCRFYTSGAAIRALRDSVRSPRLFPHKRSRVIYQPRGVVGVIGPWNWPMLNNFADAIAPLMAGNAVVLKPSEWTPLTSLRIAELWRDEGLPEDVFSVVTGSAEVGRALVDASDMVFFTGSLRAGRQVAVRAAERMIPSVLELGGKSSMIVLEDADLASAARAAVWSGFAHSGQVCIRTERVFVHSAVADEFIQRCKAEADGLRHGAGRAEPNIDVGAMTFPPQIDHLERQVSDAVEKGGRALTGGKRGGGPGNYFEPTLIVDADVDMKVMVEETFGPLLPIMRVSSADEALRLTNDSRLGLSGSVWSRDVGKAERLARQVEAGSVCVNDVLLNYMCVEAPLGGHKDSGLGIRHGIEGLRQFCRLQTVVEGRWLLGGISNVLARYLAFPYDSRLRAALRYLLRFWI